MKFKMNGIEFQIIEMSQNEYKDLRLKEDKSDGVELSKVKEGVYLGATHHKTCKIYIDTNMPEDRKRRTLLHELMHCYIYEYIGHSEMQFSDEDIADICASSHDIIHEIVESYFNRPKTGEYRIEMEREPSRLGLAKDIPIWVDEKHPIV